MARKRSLSSTESTDLHTDFPIDPSVEGTFVDEVAPEVDPKGETPEVVPEASPEVAPEPEAPEVAPKVEITVTAPPEGDTVDPKQPASVELRVGDQESRTPKELTREVIETSVREKLSKKTDDQKSDPFVPQSQLDNEVVQVAREKGFPLSRGTEIGARLLARSRRTK